MKIGVYLSA